MSLKMYAGHSRRHSLLYELTNGGTKPEIKRFRNKWVRRRTEQYLVGIRGELEEIDFDRRLNKIAI